MNPLIDKSPHSEYQSFGPEKPSWGVSIIQSIFCCCFPKTADRNYSLSSRGSSVSSKKSFFGSFSSRGRTSSIDSIPYMLFEDLDELPQLSQKTKNVLIQLGLDPSTPQTLTTTMQFFLKSNQHMIREEEHYCYMTIVEDDATLVLLLPNKALKMHARVVEIPTFKGQFYNEKLNIAIQKAIDLGDNLVMMASQGESYSQSS